jgi:hypothetical protein
MTQKSKKKVQIPSDSSDLSDEDRSNKSENIHRNSRISPSKGLR